ncbi:Lipase 1-like protein [Cladobotryum mycophilum]|uniref:Lipase 1-like protein n=1 Tax=Cladobotryum mycophilum TaxID=491253 RepID=A0ABR0SQX8_9HYPO
MDSTAYPISDSNRGIRNLRRQVGAIRSVIPVPGFSGWGRPFLGTVNYFGGFEDLALILSQLGYIVIVVRIGPISSNRERACEIFAQLTDPAGFVRAGTYGVPIPVNYGNGLPAPNQALVAAATTLQAVLYDTPANSLPVGWKWGDRSPSGINKVNFICHSQGGTTIRYLIELLSGTSTPELPDFIGVNRQPWVNSVITIGTPHKGTTVTGVVHDIIPDNQIGPLIDFITSCSFEARQERIYDLHLDHWGFFRAPGQTYQAMRAQIAPIVSLWWTRRVNGLFDNSITGVRNLDVFAPNPSLDIYYFTMSFSATTPFPDETLTADDINGWLALFPGDQIWNPFGLWGHVVAPFQPLAAMLRALPASRAVLSWITTVANQHLKPLGYFSEIPQPGSQVPRSDMLPLIMYPAYAMGGRSILPVNALPGISSEDFQPNDGIVNTRSMDGPTTGPVESGDFAAEFAANPTNARGRYWHLGINSTMDHADEIGVFTDADTNLEVQAMYIMFAELADRLT